MAEPTCEILEQLVEPTGVGVAAATVPRVTKAELYELVDALPEESLPAAAILLRRAQDPVIAKLDAAP
jgi:hypothetical protein